MVTDGVADHFRRGTQAAQHSCAQTLGRWLPLRGEDRHLGAALDRGIVQRSDLQHHRRQAGLTCDQLSATLSAEFPRHGIGFVGALVSLRSPLRVVETVKGTRPQNRRAGASTSTSGERSAHCFSPSQARCVLPPRPGGVTTHRQTDPISTSVLGPSSDAPVLALRPRQVGIGGCSVIGARLHQTVAVGTGFGMPGLPALKAP